MFRCDGYMTWIGFVAWLYEFIILSVWFFYYFDLWLGRRVVFRDINDLLPDEQPPESTPPVTVRSAAIPLGPPETEEATTEQQPEVSAPVEIKQTTPLSVFLAANLLKPESFVDKSPYVEMTPPAWQASIWRIKDGTRRLVGHANKISGHIVTNWHVLAEVPVDELFLVIMRRGKQEVVVPIGYFAFTSILDDIVAAPIVSGRGYTLTGLKDMPIKHIQGYQPACIATDFPDTNASVAGVKNHPEAWGMVVYEGSTRGGFSGASYFHGNAGYGVHSHGGVHNVGYAASYIAMKLKHNESSDFYALSHMLETSRDRRYRARRVSPDEYEVEYGGRYFRIENEEFMEIEDQYAEEFNWRHRGRRQPREEHEYHGKGRRDRDHYRRYGESNKDLEPPVSWLEQQVHSKNHVPEFNPQIADRHASIPIELQFDALVDEVRRARQSYEQCNQVIGEQVIWLIDQVEELKDQMENVVAVVDRLPPIYESAKSSQVEAKVETVRDQLPHFTEEELRAYAKVAAFKNPQPAVEVPAVAPVESAPENATAPPSTMGGSNLTSEPPTDCPPTSPPQDPLQTLLKEFNSSGREWTERLLDRVLKPIQNTLVEQRKLLSTLVPERNSNLGRGSNSGTERSTPPARWSRPRPRRSGSPRQRPSTLRDRPDSAPILDIRRSETRSGGTGSGSQTGPTGNPSNSKSLPASKLSPAGAAAVARETARPVPTTSNSSSN